MRQLLIGLAAIGGLLSPALAEPVTDFDVDLVPLSAAVEPSDSLTGGDVLGESDLGTMAGGIDLNDLQSNTANTVNTSTNNTVSGDVQTGVISGTSVKDVSGFNTLMLNTGNNVVMQSVTQVNIILK